MDWEAQTDGKHGDSATTGREDEEPSCPGNGDNDGSHGANKHANGPRRQPVRDKGRGRCVVARGVAQKINERAVQEATTGGQ